MRAAETIRTPATRTPATGRWRRWLLATVIAAALLVAAPAAALAGPRSSQAAATPAKVEADAQPTAAPAADDQPSSVLIWVVAAIAVLAIMTPSVPRHHHYHDAYHDPYWEHY
jgi:hypothetical protein